LRKVLEALGIQASSTEVKGLMNLMDSDGSGSIDFEEFANILADQFYKKPSRKDLETAFKYFDTGLY
jgi:Ca2+-binding EF-hand superfamily protein